MACLGARMGALDPPMALQSARPGPSRRTLARREWRRLAKARSSTGAVEPLGGVPLARLPAALEELRIAQRAELDQVRADLHRELESSLAGMQLKQEQALIGHRAELYELLVAELSRSCAALRAEFSEPLAGLEPGGWVKADIETLRTTWNDLHAYLEDLDQAVDELMRTQRVDRRNSSDAFATQAAAAARHGAGLESAISFVHQVISANQLSMPGLIGDTQSEYAGRVERVLSPPPELPPQQPQQQAPGRRRKRGGRGQPLREAPAAASSSQGRQGRGPAPASSAAKGRGKRSDLLRHEVAVASLNELYDDEVDESAHLGAMSHFYERYDI